MRVWHTIGVTLEMIKWEHSVFAIPFALTAAMLAASGWPRVHPSFGSLFYRGVTLGFVIAFVSRRMFGGALSDPNGIPPLRLTLFGVVLCVDLNFAAVVAALASLGAILAIY